MPVRQVIVPNRRKNKSNQIKIHPPNSLPGHIVATGLEIVGDAFTARGVQGPGLARGLEHGDGQVHEKGGIRPVGAASLTRCHCC